MMAQRGKNGALPVSTTTPLFGGRAVHAPGESADGADLAPGTMRYPDCTCRQHRDGKGKPDSSVQLLASGGAR